MNIVTDLVLVIFIVACWEIGKLIGDWAYEQLLIYTGRVIIIKSDHGRIRLKDVDPETVQVIKDEIGTTQINISKDLKTDDKDTV